MLNGDDNEIVSRLIDLISKKTNCTCSTLFLLISKKQICTCSTLFCLSLAVVLHDYNAVLYDQNVKLPSYTLFLWRNCRICLPNILFPVFMFAFIFHCRSFLPCWPLAFLIFSPQHWIWMFFFLQNSSPLFLVTCSSSFSVIHVSVNVKNNAETEATLLLFFLSKSLGGHVISFHIKPELRLGCHTCWLSYFTLVYLWSGRTGGRAAGGWVVGRSVGVRSRDHQIFSDG